MKQTLYPLGHEFSGFETAFVNLPDYILKITDQIWEGRQIDLIHRYYTEQCAVETPSSVSIGVDAVIEGTRATLRAFPDRRLLAEDVIWSGDAARGFMSSHRIISPMTHLGDGVFGPPTGATVSVRTIADCWCINNRIAHEWLVRDQAAIARAIGVEPRALAERWLAARGDDWRAPTAPRAPAPYVDHIDSSAAALHAIDTYRSLFEGDVDAALSREYDPAIAALTPGETLRYGQKRLASFWHGYRTAFSNCQLSVEHCIVRTDQRQPIRLALRWRLGATHSGSGLFGDPSGRRINVLGISHLEIRNDKIYREWILVDEIALWMQLLCGQSQ